MTEPEFNAAVSSGSIQTEAPDAGDQGGAAAPAAPSISITQFIPLLMQLQSVQLCVSAAPTYIPQTFQEQIVFVFNGSDYFLYLYFNNQWNEFAVSGGGGSGNPMESLHHVIDHRLRDAGVEADPENVSAGDWVSKTGT